MAAQRGRARVGGSAFTVFKFDNKIMAFAEEVSVQEPQPVAAAEPIQPLNAQRPLEIITPGAHSGGTITLTLTELYNQSVWQRLSASLNNAQDIVDIMRIIAERDPEKAFTLDQYILPPMASERKKGPQYHRTFYGCVITNVGDEPPINIRTMRIDRTVTLMYTYDKKFWINGGNRVYGLAGTPNPGGPVITI